MIEYAVLRLIWWLLMGVLLGAFAVMDGFDLGVAALLPIVGRNDIERRVMINTVGPVWEGNQVWFILGGGVFFAAWPYLYAVSFSGFYLAMFLVLLTFIMRPVGFKYRSKVQHPAWRSIWDWILSIAGFLAALVFGVAVGNVLQGVPFYFDDALRSYYTGSLWDLFNPFAILCGLVSVMMLLMQGAHYLIVKTEDEIRQRSIKAANISAVLVIVLFAIGGLWIAKNVKGYVLSQIISYDLPSHPLHQSIVSSKGAWLNNYFAEPLLLIIPLLGFLGAIGAMIFSRVGKGKLAFLFSSISVFFIICTVGASMFPFILPSSTEMSSSLLVWSASASQMSLQIMLISTIIFLPIILFYTTWVYRVLRGKVTADFLEKNKDAY